MSGAEVLAGYLDCALWAGLDRGLGELGDRLSELAHSFGESELYVDDEGSLQVS